MLPAPTAADIAEPETIDLRNHADSHARALEWMWSDTRAPAPLDGGVPLYRQALLLVKDTHGKQQWLWYQRYHHIMLDGFSFTALTRRIATIYNELAEGAVATPNPFIGVAAVADENEAYRLSPQRDKDQAFWRAYCEALPPAASLSARAAPERNTADDLISHDLVLPTGTLAALQQLAAAHALARTERLTAPDLILGLLAVYLYRMTGQARQAIGVPFMRRMGSVAINALAPVVNVLPVLADLTPQMDWLQAAVQFKRALKQVRPHQRYDAEQIQRDLQLVGTGQKLYGALINYKMFDYQLDFAGGEGATHHLATGPVDDLEFGLQIHGERVSIELRADAARYDMAALHAHGERIAQLLQAALASPGLPIDRLDVMTAPERDAIAGWSQGVRFEPEAGLHSVLDIFFQQAAQTPTAIALVCGDVRLSFDALAERVSQLSWLLIARGAGPQRVVAVALPRSADSVVAMLAVLNSGATFLPLDLDYPADRMAMMCEDAMPALLLSVESVTSAVPSGITRLNLDSGASREALAACASHPLAPRAELTAQSVAYIIFTSRQHGTSQGRDGIPTAPC